MNISTYIFVLFSISAIFYLMGYQPIIFTTLAGEVGTDQPIAQTLINNFFNIFSNPLFLTALGITAVASFLLSSANFSVFFIVPIIMLSVFANIFILPSSYLFDPNLPDFLKLFIGIFFNLFMMMAVINFIRGGGT